MSKSLKLSILAEDCFYKLSIYFSAAFLTCVITGHKGPTRKAIDWNQMPQSAVQV
jgi:hypothetical protein